MIVTRRAVLTGIAAGSALVAGCLHDRDDGPMFPEGLTAEGIDIESVVGPTSPIANVENFTVSRHWRQVSALPGATRPYIEYEIDIAIDAEAGRFRSSSRQTFDNEPFEQASYIVDGLALTAFAPGTAEEQFRHIEAWEPIEPYFHGQVNHLHAGVINATFRWDEEASTDERFVYRAETDDIEEGVLFYQPRPRFPTVDDADIRLGIDGAGVVREADLDVLTELGRHHEVDTFS